MSMSNNDTNGNTLMNFFVALTKNESTEDLKNVGIGIVSVAFTCVVLYMAYNDPKAETDKFYLYSVFVILPIIIGVAIASKMFNGPVDIYHMYFYSGMLFAFILIMSMFYRQMNPGNVLYVTYLLQFIGVFVFIVGLAIIYRIFVRTIINTRGWLGLFLKFLFLIPCLLIDVLETLISELKSAPKMVIFLFVIELVIILTYLYTSRVVNPSSNYIVLLNKPVFLSKTKPIGHAKDLFMDKNDVDNPSKEENVIRQNYSISMWFYVNQHPDTYAAYSKETNIFRYGYPNSTVGHPKLAYFNDKKDTNKTDKFIVYVTPDSSGILLQIPTQSWNNLVISYDKSVVDIFVNGNLEKSVPLSSGKIPEYNTGDVIEVGEGDNTVTNGGLHGAICNIVYHKAPLTASQIAIDYNLNRYNNPPVNN